MSDHAYYGFQALSGALILSVPLYQFGWLPDALVHGTLFALGALIGAAVFTVIPLYLLIRLIIS